MEPTGTNRKLAAILMADVVGYSRLMGRDEDETIERLKAFRQVFADLVGRSRGRIVNAPGDSILAEFGSAQEAVTSAVEIQRELAERNAALADDRRMLFRIGVNLGDVVVEHDAIYGDGVNVAARLESLAEPGGICISGAVHANVQNRLPYHYEFIGRQEVKNIDQPIPTFRVLSKPGAAAHRVTRARRKLLRAWRNVALVSGALVILAGIAAGAAWYLAGAPEEDPVLALPTGPSIAVLPFINMSSDPEQEYFADGITETIITTLSKLSNLMVIARNSTFTYKGKAVDVRRVSREMGVRYVLEGSVQKAGDRVRISAQLIDGTTGEHLWAESYDRTLRDIFAVQDEITRKIVTELSTKWGYGEP